MNRPDQGKLTQDLEKGRGWLEAAEAAVRADRVAFPESVEVARAAALIGTGFVQLAAAEREAAAQAFVDERHAAERAEDLARIAANRTEDLERIAAADAKAWEHQDSEAEVRAAVVEAHRATAERMRAEQELLGDVDAAAVGAAVRRVRQAAEEARPHDGEPLSLHTALAVGIDRGLRDLGAELSGCTPSMLTGHVIRELRDAGLHPSEADRG